MNDSDLQHLVEKISQKDFQKSFQHRALWNNRLQSSGGRYKLSTHDIDINPKVYEKFGMTLLEKVIKHELCHYHLHLENAGYKHRDRDFKELLEKVGGTRFVPKLKEATLHVYFCQKCSHSFTRKRRMDCRKFRCGNCGGTLRKKG